MASPRTNWEKVDRPALENLCQTNPKKGCKRILELYDLLDPGGIFIAHVLSGSYPVDLWELEIFFVIKDLQEMQQKYCSGF